MARSMPSIVVGSNASLSVLRADVADRQRRLASLRDDAAFIERERVLRVQRLIGRV